MIQRARAHPDQRFARASYRIWGLLVPQYVGTAMRVKTDRLHLRQTADQGRETYSYRSIVNSRCGPKRNAGSEPAILSKSPTITVVIFACSRYRRAAAVASAALTCDNLGTNCSKYESGKPCSASCATERATCPAVSNPRGYPLLTDANACATSWSVTGRVPAMSRISRHASCNAALVTSVPTLVCITNGPMPRRRLNPVRTP